MSRLVSAEYWEEQCPLFFPPEDGGYGLMRGKTAEDVDAYTGGWFLQDTERLMLTNGGLDPWRDSTVSSDFRPGGPLQSTPELPVRVVTGGIHCSDLYGQNWAVNAELQALVDDEVANMKEWVEEFYLQKRKRVAFSA